MGKRLHGEYLSLRDLLACSPNIGVSGHARAELQDKMISSS